MKNTVQPQIRELKKILCRLNLNHETIEKVLDFMNDIQRNTNINPCEIEESFNEALNFFQEYYPEHKCKAFICYPWLLFHGNHKLLSKESNIIKFAKRFEIISEIQDNQEAIFNIYGEKFQEKKDYLMYTSLQRRGLSMLNHLGYACGVIYL